ncbi:hypothetical protein HMPREF9088_1512 [Enterococcus italicus DSM 15952]|uniref:Uncharacterized protein n=1 Tax=Enterococcus italicus (strain DSM 15952 / CCUG 50447 / LMG 22039 / TP 1.5) TaxID=888064 RepID=E6LGM2_ENTI1|nr:hypothetical protein HMPREF9088_1512 [Enterococcus italicus DSM 15952]
MQFFQQILASQKNFFKNQQTDKELLIFKEACCYLFTCAFL